jgi:hypothetical protein
MITCSDYPVSCIAETFVILTVIVIVLAVACDFANKLCAKRQIAKLRAAGTIPPEGQGGDADIVRLANEGKRREAALLYMALKGGSIDKARVVVGVGPKPGSAVIAVYSFLLILSAIACFLTETAITFTLVWLVCLVAEYVIWKDSSRKVEANRKEIAAGNLPKA